MSEVTKKLTVWLQEELAKMPEEITAAYVEYDEPHANAQAIKFCLFGFENLADGEYDPDNPDHAGLLGEFTWEGKERPKFAATDAKPKDWHKSLRSAVKSPPVQKLIKSKRLQFIIGEHDGNPEVVVP